MTKLHKKIIVNTLTASRILGALVLPFIFMSLNTTHLIVLLIILFLTDFLDGKLSRHWGVQTVGGGLLDPLGDKMLAIVCILALLKLNLGFYLVLILELLIGLINVYGIMHGIKTQSILIGKIKNWFLSITLILAIAYLFDPNILNIILESLNISGIDLRIRFSIIQYSMSVLFIFEIITVMGYMEEYEKIKSKSDEHYQIYPLKEIIKILFDETRYMEDREKPLLEIIKVRK